MKGVIKVLLFSLITLSLVSPVLAEEAVVTVKGLVCSFCAQGIKKTFAKQSEVLDTKVDLESKLVTLTLKDGSKLSDSEIDRLIVDAGYSVVRIERRGQNHERDVKK